MYYVYYLLKNTKISLMPSHDRFRVRMCCTLVFVCPLEKKPIRNHKLFIPTLCYIIIALLTIRVFRYIFIDYALSQLALHQYNNIYA